MTKSYQINGNVNLGFEEIEQPPNQQLHKRPKPLEIDLNNNPKTVSNEFKLDQQHESQPKYPAPPSLAKKNEKQKEKKEKTNTIQPKIGQDYWWDVARVTSRDFELEQMQLKSRIQWFKLFFKLFAYLIFFTLVLCSAVASKLSFFTMINSYKKVDQPNVYRIRWNIMLATGVSFPYLLSFLSCLQNVCFGASQNNPNILLILGVLIIEVAQSLGSSIMIFKILPYIKNINGLFLMNSVCVVPSILKLIFQSRRGMNRLKKSAVFFCDLIAIGAQASIWFMFKYEDFNYISKTNNLNVNNEFLFYLFLATFLISLGWWENYAEVRYTTNRLSLFIQSQINSLRKYRSKVYVIVEPIKVACTFLFGYLFLPKYLKDDYSRFNEQFNFNTSASPSLPVYEIIDEPMSLNNIETDIFFTNSGFYWPLIIHVLSSAICFYTGRVACKVLMQAVGFSLPLSLSTWVAFALIGVASYYVDSDRIAIFNFLTEYFFLDRFDRKFN